MFGDTKRTLKRVILHGVRREGVAAKATARAAATGDGRMVARAAALRGRGVGIIAAVARLPYMGGFGEDPVA